MLQIPRIRPIQRSVHRAIIVGYETRRYQHSYSSIFTAADPDLFSRSVSCFHRRHHNADDSCTDWISESQSILAQQNPTDRRGEIFANNDTPLAHVQWFGFDFDFTLAQWRDSVGHLIYEQSKQFLIEQLAYPREHINRCNYNSNFPIRGLHFDTNTGFLLKLDQFGKIQLETVHRGRTRVSVDEVIAKYDGITVSKPYELEHLHLMSDLFCLPEICLLADVIQCFVDRRIDFSALYIYKDVRKAIDSTHSSGMLHDAIIDNPSDFIEPEPQIKQLLTEIRKAGRKTFLLTNSGFRFVDAGMRHMLGMKPPTWKKNDNQPPSQPIQCCTVKSPASDSANHPGEKSWLDLFDVAIFSARKPNFWTRQGKFRLIDQRTGSLSFAPVNELKRGHAYTWGSLAEFERLTGARSTAVLYAGDSHAADLVNPSESALWRTVAVLKELENETAIMGSLPFRQKLRELFELEALIDYGQRLDDAQSKKLLEELKSVRKSVRHDLLVLVHPHFGSVFRTASHRTKLFFEISRFSDVYTSSICNLLHYNFNYCFYAQRGDLPHEPPRQVVMVTPITTTERRKDEEQHATVESQSKSVQTAVSESTKRQALHESGP